MENYLLKIETIDSEIPHYRVSKAKPLSAFVSTEVEMSSSFEDTYEECVYRREKIKTHLNGVIGCYVDDKSFSVLDRIMALSNETVKQATDKATKKLVYDFEMRLAVYYKELGKERDKIREFPWYKRLFKLF